jgi:hypothetical protein
MSTAQGDLKKPVEDFEADMLVSISASKYNDAQKHSKQVKGKSNLDRRAHFRHPVRWHVAIVNRNGGVNDTYHGRTHDVSLLGMTVFLDQNIFFTSRIIALLAIPPIHHGQKETILVLQCRQTHTVLDSVHGRFRLGISFIQAKSAGAKILSDVLSRRHIPINEPNPFEPLRISESLV